MRAGIGASTLTTTPSSSATIRGENGGRRQNNLSYVNSCCFIKVGEGNFLHSNIPQHCITWRSAHRFLNYASRRQGAMKKKKRSRLYWRKEWCLMHFHCLTPTSQEVNSLPRTSSFFFLRPALVVATCRTYLWQLAQLLLLKPCLVTKSRGVHTKKVPAQNLHIIAASVAYTQTEDHWHRKPLTIHNTDWQLF